MATYQSVLGLTNLQTDNILTGSLYLDGLATKILVVDSTSQVKGATLGANITLTGTTIDTGQGILPTDTPTFVSTTLTGLSASSLTCTDASKTLASASVNSTNLIFSASTLNTIQNIATSSSPTFAGLTITGLSGVLKATAGVVSGSSGLNDLTDAEVVSDSLYLGDVAPANPYAGNTIVGINSLGASTNALGDATIVGSGCGTSLTSNNFNTFIGRSVGNSVTSGGYNTLLGGSSDATTTTQYACGVGYNCRVSGNNACGLGSAISATHLNSVCFGYGATSSSTSQVTFGNGTSSITSIVNGTDNACDLGSSGRNFKDLYLSSYAYTPNIRLSALTASSLVYLDASKDIKNLTTGTSISLAGSTLNTIQGIRTVDSPTFAGLTLTGLSGVLKASAGVVSGSSSLSDLADVNQGSNNLQFSSTITGLGAGHSVSNSGTAVGALAIATGLRSLALGYDSRSTGQGGIAIGESSRAQDSYGIAIGYQCSTGDDSGANLNTCIGFQCNNASTTGEQGTFAGAAAGRYNTTSYNTYYGFGAGDLVNPVGTLGKNVAIGWYSMANHTGSSNCFVGSHQISPSAKTSSYACSLGNLATCSGDYAIALGQGVDAPAGKMVIGTSTNLTGVYSGCTTNTVDLGTSSNKWKDLHVGTSIYTPSIQLSGLTASSLTCTDASKNLASASVNSTNLTFSASTLNTIQNIATSSSPTFSALTLTGGLTTTGPSTIGISADSSNCTIEIGDGPGSKSIYVGSSNTTSITRIMGGSGGILIGSEPGASVTTNIGTGSSGNQYVNLGTNSNATSSVSIAGLGGFQCNTYTGTINVSSDSVATTVNVATGAGVKTLTLGSTNTSSVTTLQSGTGNTYVSSVGSVFITAQSPNVVDINSDNNAGYTRIGVGSAFKAVDIGSTNTTSQTRIYAGSGGLELASTGATTINSSTGTMSISSDGVSTTVNVATGAGVKTLTLGSNTSSSQTSIYSGTGNMYLTSSGSINLQAGASQTMNVSTDNTITTLNIGTGSAVKVLTIGSTDTTSSTVIQSGTGDVTIKSTDKVSICDKLSTVATVNIGTASLNYAVVTIGSTTASSKTTLVGEIIDVGVSSTASETINVGVSGSSTKTLTLGSDYSSSTTNIKGGSGNINFTGDVLPSTNSTYDIGSSSKKVAEVHADGLFNYGNTGMTSAVNLGYGASSSTGVGTVTFAPNHPTNNITQSGWISLWINNGQYYLPYFSTI